MTKTGKKDRTKATLLIFLIWLVYATSYLGKMNYSANITQIIDYYRISKAEAGSVSSFFFFSYGIGQVVNGILCKRYNIKWTIFISLIVSSLINFLVPLCPDFSVIKWLWLVNGFTLSMLWPTIVRLLSESIPQKDLSLTCAVVGTTVATGTLVIYALSSLYALFGSFALSFYTASFAVFIVALIWILVYKKADAMSKEEKEKDVAFAKKEDKKETENVSLNGKMFSIVFGILCFFAVGVNLTKDGLTTWVPSILKDTFEMSDSLSILLTLTLPIVAIFGNVWALRVHKKIPDYITHCATDFFLNLIFIGIIVGALSLKLALVMLISLILVNFLASSLNSLITSVFPLFVRNKGNSGFYAGLLNGFSYLGSAISSYGLGFIADNFGWYGVFFTLGIFCFVSIFVWLCYTLIKRISKSTL